MLGEWFFCICNVILGMCAKIFWVLYQVDVNTEVGVVRDIRLKELRLYTDYGRCSRPLFIVEKQRLLIKKEDVRALQMKVRGNENHVEIMSTWAARCSVCPLLFFSDCQLTVVCLQETSENGWYDLVSKGFIEYVDTEEEETTMISMTIAVCSA